MSTKPDIRKGLIARVLSALQEDRFLLHAQTIAPLSSKPAQQPFQEIFVRYRDEDEKLLPPGSFLYILEEYKLLSYLDRWVVNRLARWSRDMLKADPDWKVPRCNVNLATDTIADEQFGEYVRQHIVRSPLSQSGIGFEIDWDSAIAYQEPLRRLITELRPHGCLFTLADFDGSDESFQTLKSFAPHFVKTSSATLDRTRLAEINRRCRLLECKTIVEYVESQTLLEELRRANTDFAQGFAISPVEAL
jgi:EAL domain-containing protein (putative c-di-GMP-specific phosphodiesterase class I)